MDLCFSPLLVSFYVISSFGVGGRGECVWVCVSFTFEMLIPGLCTGAC